LKTIQEIKKILGNCIPVSNSVFHRILDYNRGGF
jgi:hypothetical protein